jgi:hypothetical protein
LDDNVSEEQSASLFRIEVNSENGSSGLLTTSAPTKKLQGATNQKATVTGDAWFAISDVFKCQRTQLYSNSSFFSGKKQLLTLLLSR